MNGSPGTSARSWLAERLTRDVVPGTRCAGASAGRADGDSCRRIRPMRTVRPARSDWLNRLRTPAACAPGAGACFSAATSVRTAGSRRIDGRDEWSGTRDYGRASRDGARRTSAPRQTPRSFDISEVGAACWTFSCGRNRQTARGAHTGGTTSVSTRQRSPSRRSPRPRFPITGRRSIGQSHGPAPYRGATAASALQPPRTARRSPPRSACACSRLPTTMSGGRSAAHWRSG